MKELAARAKTAELDRSIANAEARKSANEAKIAESRRRMEGLATQSRRAQTARENFAIARCYATEVSDKLKSLSDTRRQQLHDAAVRRATSVEAGKAALPRHVPGCWPAGLKKTDGLRQLILPKGLKEGDVYASEAFMFKLYGKARPQNTHPFTHLRR